ncbi:hypothetical protein [Acinetobacter halotolerans]|nr:hypothetical protein [Acinetobacter halotolerans]
MGESEWSVRSIRLHILDNGGNYIHEIRACASVFKITELDES